MPHKQRPAFEAAVTASPLFKLALEIRIMIYELLLIQEGGMCIPSDIFARRDYGRTGSTPFECTLCGLDFLSDYGCLQHINKRHHRRRYNSDTPRDNRQFLRPRRPLLPEVSISLLQTCRLVRLEASPILYSKNGFHFSDPGTVSNFRWGTDIAQAGAAQEIGIRFASNDISPWVTYITKRALSLGQDFSHLKRMIISFDRWVLERSFVHLRLMSKVLRERYRGLDWVLVLMLSDEKLLDCFEALVDREYDSTNGQKEVRRHVWANEVGGGWRNALLWWGFLGEAVPQQYRSIGDQPQQQILSQRTDEGVSTQLTIPAS